MTFSLECWGHGWVWRDCEGLSAPGTKLRKVALSPFTQQAVQVTWTPVNEENPKIFLGKLPSEDQILEDTMPDTPDTSLEVSNTRFVLARLTSDATIIVDDVDPDQVYRITMAPDKNGNLSNIFFRINENQNYTSDIAKSKTGDSIITVRAEEVTLVVLILALWMIAIGLFVHRWGKIRMLEPYQPEYKHNHEPTCPLNPSTSPTHTVPATNLVQRVMPPLPTYRVLPRKSSSLCFTPSMLQSGQIPPQWRVCVPHFDGQITKGLSPASRIAHHRFSGRLGSDALIYHDVINSQQWQKARSAENLWYTRITGKSEESINTYRKGSDAKETHLQDMHTVATKKGKQPILLDVVTRGMSLDSSAYGLRRASATAPSWSTGMGVSCPFPEGRTTPEIRISPTPDSHRNQGYSINTQPETSVPIFHGSQSRPPGIQRQETVKEEASASCATIHGTESQPGIVTNRKQDASAYSSQLPSNVPSVPSQPSRKGTLKKHKVITSRGSDETHDTQV